VKRLSYREWDEVVEELEGIGHGRERLSGEENTEMIGGEGG
jgi:hypothetical protein